MRKICLSLAASLLALSGLAFVSPAQPAAAATAQAKVVIVVGATHGTTSSYRSDADHAAAVFRNYTSNVVKVYSPNATWSAVQAAASGANILVYLGHGNGQPSPYHSGLTPSSTEKNSVDGMGLNATANNGDSNTKYYGENYMQTLGLAPNAVVILQHLCYASGDSEWMNAPNDPPTPTKAHYRIDNFAAGFLRAGAKAVIAEGVGSIDSYINGIFNSHSTIDRVWKSAPNFHNHVTSWESVRNPGYTSQMDPDYDDPAPDGDPYYRSMVSIPTLSTDLVVGPVAPLPSWVTRYGGATRFDSAASVAKGTYAAGVPAVYIANAYNFPDALAGAAAASKLQGPVLLVAPSLPIHAATVDALSVLKPQQIVVLGGTGSVGADVATELQKYTAGKVTRYGGANRFESAANVAMGTFTKGVRAVYIANAYNFPDALAGAAAASTIQGPVLLVGPKLPMQPATIAALQALAPQDIFVLGGTGSVGADVATELQKYTAGKVTRYGGATRFESCATVSANTFAPGVAAVYIANAYNFPDALAGAAAASKIKGPVLLVDTSGSLNPAIQAELLRLNPQRVIVLGGTGSVPDSTARTIAGLFPTK